MSPIKLCLELGCGKPRVTRGRCREHATENRRYTRSVNDGFYSSKAWRMTRKAYLFANPLCEDCADVASDVHHVVPIEDGGAKRDPANLRALCRSCHSKRHAEIGLGLKDRPTARAQRIFDNEKSVDGYSNGGDI
jgi:5-methylcytosine-specific restriction protein A